MNSTELKSVILQALRDSETLYAECDTEEQGKLDPKNTDWDGESFAFSWTQLNIDDEHRDEASGIYLTAFWAHVEHLQFRDAE